MRPTPSERPASPAAPTDGYVTCSREQEGLWILEQTRPIGASNNIPVALDIRGPLDVGALREALRRMIERHGALRTQFVVRDGRLLRRECCLVDLGAVELATTDASGLTVDDLLQRLVRRQLDPLRWPQFDATLIRADGSHHILCVVFHHCVFDGTSVDIALNELPRIYGSIVEGAPARDSQAVAYSEYVRDEQRTMDTLAAKAETYWRPALAAVENAARMPRSPTRDPDAHAGEVVEFTIDATLKEAIEQGAKRGGVSVFTTLLAVLHVLLHRYCGGGDDSVATAIAFDGRPQAMRSVIGMFANELPLHTQPSEAMTFADYLDDVVFRLSDLFELSRYPFTEAIGRFGRSGEGIDSGVQAAISYRKVADATTTIAGIDFRPLRITAGHVGRRSLTWGFFDDPSSIAGRLEYDPGVTEPEVARAMCHHLTLLLARLTSDPGVRLGDVELLTQEERIRVLQQWSHGATGESTAETVHELVERSVARDPDATAVRFEGSELSYAELNARANRLAHHLRRRGVGADVPVALCVDRSDDLVVGLLGILKAGGAYLPLDPDYPAERLALMLSDSNAAAVVSQEHVRGRLPVTEASVVLLDADSIATERSENLPPSVSSEHLAYVIYTSGSTGIPKGVAMPHGALCNLLDWQRSQFVLRGPIKTLQFASVSFDVAFQEIFSTLTTGGCLQLIPGELRRDFDKLAAFVQAERLERMFVPALVLNELARRFVALPHRRGRLEAITAGEQLEITPSIRRAWSQQPGWTLENQYGPTESHVVTSHRLSDEVDRWPDLPPIGRPIANSQIYILSPSGRPVPVGVPGELCIGGDTLARGYLDRADLTRDRFARDPVGLPTRRIYRSGDLARWRTDGAIDFLGRIDQQIKVRGYRVEPGEIEAVLVRRSDVQEAAVVALSGDSGIQQLVAYVVPVPACDPHHESLRESVEQSLPAHMVPSAFVQVDALPLTPNGKLDRRALPKAELRADQRPGYVAPRTLMERRLAFLWSDVLGVERVGVQDNFFHLGGHSLHAAEVVGRARKAFDADLPLALLFAAPTVADMARGIDEALAEAPQQTAIPRTPRRIIELAEDARGT